MERDRHAGGGLSSELGACLDCEEAADELEFFAGAVCTQYSRNRIANGIFRHGFGSYRGLHPSLLAALPAHSPALHPASISIDACAYVAVQQHGDLESIYNVALVRVASEPWPTASAFLSSGESGGYSGRIGGDSALPVAVSEDGGIRGGDGLALVRSKLLAVGGDTREGAFLLLLLSMRYDPVRSDRRGITQFTRSTLGGATELRCNPGRASGVCVVLPADGAPGSALGLRPGMLVVNELPDFDGAGD